MNTDTDKRARYRRLALYTALFLALTLLVLDRTAAYLHRPAPDSTAVVIYTTQWCPYCTTMRAWLDYHDIPYSEYDVEKSFQGGMGFWALRGIGVPLVVAGPDIIYGFDSDKLRQSLAALGYRLRPEHDPETIAPRGADAPAVSEL